MDIKSIGVLTSGGDAPGMNAAIRAVTRAAIYEGWKVYGIYRGWEGLIMGDIKEFTSSSVSNTIQRGGTILKTARSEEFRTKEGRAKAAANIKKFGIDSLITHLQESWWIEVSMNLVHLGFKCLGRMGCKSLLESPCLLQIREVLSNLCQYGYLVKLFYRGCIYGQRWQDIYLAFGYL